MITKTVENCIETIHQECPDGFTEIAQSNPHSCPWDSYGNKFVNETLHVMRAAGIEGIPLYTHRKAISPLGTGPGGRVRFGDDMAPSTYRIAVKTESVASAIAAIAEHNAAVKRWIHDGEPMPEACRV